LKAYRHFKSGSAIPRSKIAQVLWSDSDHPFVQKLRDSVRTAHPALSLALQADGTAVADRVLACVEKYGEAALPTLAAVLWATGLAAPGGEAAFRLLIAIDRWKGVQQGSEPVQRAENGVGQAGSEVKGLKRDLAQANRARADAERRAVTLDALLHKSQEDATEIRIAVVDAKGREKQLQELLRNERALVKELREAKTTLNALAERRLTDLQERQQQQRRLEAERSDLALQLATAKLERDQLKRQAEGIPQGAAAAWQFLQAEQSRLSDARLLELGSARQATEDVLGRLRRLERAFLDEFPELRRPRRTKPITKSRVKLVALGGSAEVGKSCYYLEWGDHRLMVDCGIKPGSRLEDEAPLLERVEGLDAVILTHAHADHVGWVPALLNRFPHLPVYCSEATAALLPVVLEDGFKHYQGKLRRQRELALHLRNANPVRPGYTEEDLGRVRGATFACQFGAKVELPAHGMTVRFFRAGHVVGAASVLLEDESGRRIFFSGDFASFDQRTILAADWSQVPRELDLLVMESTYGDRRHDSRRQSTEDLITFASQTLQRDGTLLLPSFALGRAQELLSLLVEAKARGEIPPVPIYVDGLIQKINPIYKQHARFPYQHPNDFYEVLDSSERHDLTVESQANPAIIVTTSGMLYGGPILYYAPALLPNPRHRIGLTGFQDEGAPSQALRAITEQGKKSRKVQLFGDAGEPIVFEAGMPAREFALSAHADQPGLVEYAAQLDPTHIALVHGEAHAQKALRTELLNRHPRANIVCGPEEFQLG